MGGGNAQKSATARERNLEKLKKAKGGASQLEANKKASSIVVSLGMGTAAAGQEPSVWALDLACVPNCSAPSAAQPSSARPR